MDFTYCLKCVTFFNIPLMASLNILCLAPRDFLKEITKKVTKESHKKIFLTYQKFSKIFVAHGYILKMFHGPCKNPQASSSILNV